MNRRKLIGVIASLVVAAMGTFIILNYVNSSEKAATPVALQTVPVLKAIQAIPKGTPAEKLGVAVAVVQVPVAEKLADSAVSVEELTGLVANADLVQGEQVVKTRFVPAAEATKATTNVASGRIGVWVSLDPIRALAGRITPGMQVAVIASFNGVAAAQPDPTSGVPSTHLIIHKVPVLDVIGAVAAPTPEPGKEGVPAVVAVAQLQIKLGVDSASAERLVFAATNGQLWLGDEAGDTIEDGTKVIERGNVYANTPLLVPTTLAPVAPDAAIAGAAPTIPAASVASAAAAPTTAAPVAAAATPTTAKPTIAKPNGAPATTAKPGAAPAALTPATAAPATAANQ